MRPFRHYVGFVYIRDLKRSLCEVPIICLLYHNLNKECTNYSRRVAQTTKCCMVARNIFVPTSGEISYLEPRIFNWFPYFWNMFPPLA